MRLMVPASGVLQRFVGSDADRDLRCPGRVENLERVGDDLGERRVARHTADAEQFEVGMGDGVQQSEGVVDARVDV
jgi:hypothetical protein